jgi:hypothetical protein
VDVKIALIQAHRNNIERYHRLLQTHLSEIERRFIERRISEEQSALQVETWVGLDLDQRLAP